MNTCALEPYEYEYGMLLKRSTRCSPDRPALDHGVPYTDRRSFYTPGFKLTPAPYL